MEQNININERITALRNERRTYIDSYNNKMEELEQKMFKLYEEKYNIKDDVINKLLCYDIVIYDKGYDEKYTSWYTLMLENGFSVQRTLNKLFDYNNNFKIEFIFFVPTNRKIRMNRGLRYTGKNVRVGIKLSDSGRYYLSNISFSENMSDDIYFEELENKPNLFSYNDDIDKLVDKLVLETSQQSIRELINICKE